MSLLNKTAQPAKSHIKMTRQVFVLEVLDCLLQGDDIAISPQRASHMAPSFPRRGPGFQLKMLSLLCSCNRLGTSLLKRYSGLGEECLLSFASRKMALALFQTDQVAFQGRSWIPPSPRQYTHLDTRHLLRTQKEHRRQDAAKEVGWDIYQTELEEWELLHKAPTVLVCPVAQRSLACPLAAL